MEKSGKMDGQIIKKFFEEFGGYVKLVLESGRVYEGRIIKVESDLIFFKDKYGIDIIISAKDVVAIEDRNKIVKNNLNLKK